MRQAALSALACRRLAEHQAILYGHNDTEHKHVHVLVNLIHPTTGRCANTFKDRLELSRWAQSYEEQQGKIRCAQRVENNKRRENGQFIKHREENIQKAWETAKTGAEFAAALEKQGYRLAQGNKRIVIIDPDGKAFNPARKIQGVKAFDIKEKLKGLELPDADSLQKQPLGRPSKTVATSLPEKENKRLQDAEKRKELQEKEPVSTNQVKTPLPAAKLPEKSIKAPRISQKSPEKTTENPQYRSFAERLDRLQAFENGQQRRRDGLEDKLKQFYDPARTERLLAEARERVSKTDNFIGRMTGKHQQALDEASAYQKNLDNLRWRIEEQKQALENRLKAERKPFEREKEGNSPAPPEPASKPPQENAKDMLDRFQPSPSPAPAPKYKSARDMLERFEQSASPGNDNAQDKEKQDKGQEQQRGKDRDRDGYER
jgi:hypothetical protein